MQVDGSIQRPMGIGDLTNKILSLIGATKEGYSEISCGVNAGSYLN